MNIGLVVNARGKLCLVHDEKFEAPPIFVGYHLDKRQIEIFFETGASYPIDWEATDEMDAYLQKSNKILIILMRRKKPVEGYDTSLLHLIKGEAIEMSEDSGESLPSPDSETDTIEKQEESHRVTTIDTPVISSITSITDATFENNVIKALHPVLVYFWTEWCGSCRSLGSTLIELSAELQDRISISSINADEYPGLASKYGIRDIPTLLLFRGGEVAATRIGALAKLPLRSWLEELF